MPVFCCFSPFYAMSKPSGSLESSDKHERVGPDYFGYYSCEVVNLLSQEEDVLPSATQTAELPQSKCGEGRKKSIHQSDNCSSPLYSNGVGAELSEFKKERLRSLLRQSVTFLSSEVDEMLDPVLAAHHLHLRLRSSKHSVNHMANASEDAVQLPSKKLKVSSSSSPGSLRAQIGDVNPQCRKVNDDLRFLFENDSVEVEEIMTKYSDELSLRLGYMEHQLELLLDAVTSKCRPMTAVEKRQLKQLIQKLPPRNLDRVVEIICRSKPAKELHDKIFVDLEQEDNATLWRLYYYAEAVQKARRLSCSKEA